MSYEDDNKMMKIEDIVNDVVLIVVEKSKGLAAAGIDKDKFVAAENEKNRPYPKKIDIAVPANMKCGQVSL